MHGMVTVGRKLTRSRRSVQRKVCGGADTRYQHSEHWRALASPGLHRQECVGGAAVNMHGLGEKREGTFTVTINQILSGSSSRARAR